MIIFITIIIIIIITYIQEIPTGFTFYSRYLKQL